MAEQTPVQISEHTSIGLPLRNLIGLATAVAIGTWAWFGLQERLNSLETQQILMAADVTKNSIFSRDWPLGKAGSLPQDSEQFMLIEHLSNEFQKLSTMLTDGDAPFDRQQALTLDFYRERIEALERKQEVLKDKVALLKANGHTTN